MAALDGRRARAYLKAIENWSFITVDGRRVEIVPLEQGAWEVFVDTRRELLVKRGRRWGWIVLTEQIGFACSWETVREALGSVRSGDAETSWGAAVIGFFDGPHHHS